MIEWCIICLIHVSIFLTLSNISELQDTYPPIPMSATYIRFFFSRMFEMFDKSTHYHTIRRKECVQECYQLFHI